MFHALLLFSIQFQFRLPGPLPFGKFSPRIASERLVSRISRPSPNSSRVISRGKASPNAQTTFQQQSDFKGFQIRKSASSQPNQSSESWLLIGKPILFVLAVWQFYFVFALFSSRFSDFICFCYLLTISVSFEYFHFDIEFSPIDWFAYVCRMCNLELWGDSKSQIADEIFFRFVPSSIGPIVSPASVCPLSAVRCLTSPFVWFVLCEWGVARDEMNRSSSFSCRKNGTNWGPAKSSLQVIHSNSFGKRGSLCILVQFCSYITHNSCIRRAQCA